MATEQPGRIEQQKIQIRAKNIIDVVKGVAAAYVGLQLGIAAVKFIGRRFSGKNGKNAGPKKQQRQQSSALAASTQATITATAEDSWAPVEALAPTAPEGYKQIVNKTLPCRPQELYSLLFSSSGTNFYLKQHREIGKQWDLVATSWRRASTAAPEPAREADAASGHVPDGSLLGPKSVFEWVLGQPGSGSFTRLLTFVNPKKPPNTVDTRCVQRQQFGVCQGGVLVFATAMNMLDIPFKDCFTVNSFWRVEPGAQPGTSTVTIHLKVNFIKRALGVGGIISATTMSESTAFFRAFIDNVEAHIVAIRQQAASPLPAPLPGCPATVGSFQQGSRLHRSVSRNAIVSPFAAVSGSLPPSAPAAAAGGHCGASTHLQQPLPAWKQIRSLVVLAVLAFTVLHQLYLGRELAAMRGEAGSVAGARSGGSGDTSGLGGFLGGVVRPMHEPLVAAVAVMQELLKNILGRRLPQ
ncbi:hypothetical protein Vafri_6303 [Volvox africanus]|uniref:VASt domain-containing protein n=1 Tax=Volvox africanus TaxID=51714 RepID=A0A8J4AZ31_9CHLO|nr:hypothetical protein Vafri_6303 [Volvox africanus]